MEEWQIEIYKEDDGGKWDFFVLEEALNGTFLQTRRFLSYHPTGRFEDFSIVVKEKGNLVAVCPACRLVDGEDIVFCSHAGSTYGGLIVSSRICRVEKVVRLIECMENFLHEKGFTRIIYKQTPLLFCRVKRNLLDFCLKYKGYSERQELNLYVDFAEYQKDTIKNFSNGKRGHIKQCIAKGMEFKELESENAIKAFYEILTENLRKYEKSPVHTLEEMLVLRKLLHDETGFFGVYCDGQLAAGCMTFYFKGANCLHTQYSAADSNFNKLSPMSYLIYSLVEHARQKGCASLSWGIATDHNGEINWNLTTTKESYGSVYDINHIYSKQIIDSE